MVASVRTRGEFAALSRTPHRARSGPVWVAHIGVAETGGPSDPTEVRVAYAVGRGVGTAVVRNRVRRRLRAVIRELEAGGRLAAGSYLVGVRPDVVGLEFATLASHVATAVSRAVPPPGTEPT